MVVRLSVTAGMGGRDVTVVATPALASAIAAVRPAGPPPTTTASDVVCSTIRLDPLITDAFL
jgi:hypothetical protein